MIRTMTKLTRVKAPYEVVHGNLDSIPGRNPKIPRQRPLDPDNRFQVGIQFSF